MSQINLAYSLIFKVNNQELVRATGQNVNAIAGYAVAAKDAGSAATLLSTANAGVANSAASASPAIRAEAAALGQATGQANANAAAMSNVAQSQVVLASSSRGVQRGFQGIGSASTMAGQQLQDIAISMQSGQRTSVVLAQQLPQLAFAFANVGGRVGAVATALSGPGGLLLIPLGMIVGTWIDSMFGLGDASEQSKSATERLTDRVDLMKNSYQTLIGVVDEYNDKQKETTSLTLAAAEAAALEADKLLTLAEAKLAAAKASAEANRGQGSFPGMASAVSEIQAIGLQGEIDKLRKQLDTALKTSGKIGADLSLSPALAIRNKASEDLEKLDRRKLKTAEDQLAYEKERLAILKKRDADLEALEKSKAKAKRGGKPKSEREPESLSDILGATLLGKAKSYIGLNENVRSENNALQSLFKQAGHDIDPKITAWCAAFVNAVLATEGIKGTGKLNARSFLDWGKAVDNPEKGDVVVLKRGNDKDKGHVGFFSGYDKAGNVLVTGGNQNEGQEVTTSSFKGKDVLGFRRAPTVDEAQQQVDQIARFGERASEMLGNMRAQYSDLPRDIAAAQAAIGDLTSLMAELADKQPPGFEAMIEDAKKLAPLIQDSLRRPMEDMLRDQGRQLAVGDALLANDVGRADALQVSYDLMQRFGVESEEQLATQLALRGISGDQVRAYYEQLDALREQGRELDILQQKQQVNLQFLDEFQGGLRDIVRGALGGEGLDAVGDGLQRIWEGYLDSLADQFSEALFGDVFREQQDKITGVGKVKEAGERIAAQVDKAAQSVPPFVTAVDSTKNALTGLTDALTGASADIANLSFGQPATDASTQGPTAETLADPPIVVTANRTVDKVAKSTMQELLEGVFGKDSKIAKDLPKLFQTLMKGAAEGQAASGVLASLGVKQSKLGAQISGAAGKAIGTAFLGPLGGKLGGFIGGAIGGTIGGLFKKTKTGSASLSFVDGQLVSGAVGGNSKKLQARSGELVGAVGSSLASIAEQLGGYLSGRAAVSIGYDKKGRVVVDPTGQNRTKGAGIKNFGKDGEEAARAFATLDALRDGAIAGLSDKVAQALRSSDDLDKALREALKVDEIEQILNGFGGASKRAFVDFERQARERLRVAGKYGFDLVKLEEENQKQRQKLLADSIENATGGLKAVLEDLITGAKAPGTLLDRRAALLAKKAELEKLAPTDADAAAKLADVLDQLYQVSLDAFGTAGAQFAGDREGIQSTAEAIIAAATAELTAAQEAARKNAGTDAASTEKLLGEVNAVLTQIQKLADEGNGQAAEMIALLGKIDVKLGGVARDDSSTLRAYEIGSLF